MTYESKDLTFTFDHFSSRYPAKTRYPLTISKNGARHLWLCPNGEKKEVIVLGAACSEVFCHGKQLSKVTKPSRELEQRVAESWEKDEAAECLSIHTSAGISPALVEFINEMGKNRPWRNDDDHDDDDDDWFINVQAEGATAVWSGIELLLQLKNKDDSNNLKKPNNNGGKVAIAELAYHGPGSTSFGSQQPLGNHPRQVLYPVPSSLNKQEHETIEEVNTRAKQAFTQFLTQYENKIDVLVIEPQRGSSACAEPWDFEVLKFYVDSAKAHGILVLADEIMCGLGRHGTKNIFMSKSCRLNVDGVTFGKAVGGGVGDLLSGVIIRRGANTLSVLQRSSFQSHTYAGASSKALLTATQVLREVPNWYEQIDFINETCKSILLTELSQYSNVIVHGQGAMWGLRFTHADLSSRAKAFQKFNTEISNLGVQPYVVKRLYGCMVTPPVDIKREDFVEGCRRLKKAVILALTD